MKGWASIGAKEVGTQAVTIESSCRFDEEINLGLPQEKKNIKGKTGKTCEVRLRKKSGWLNDFELDGDH